MTETQTVDLASWLTAVWDEEERLATEASRHGDEPLVRGGEHWHWECSDDHPVTPDPLTREYLQCDEGSWDVSLRSIEEYPYRNFDGKGPSILFSTDEIAAVHALHILRHDPASVLARIAADRKILELHAGGVSYPEDCGLCNEALPCETVRLLASPYKGREGWQEAWE